MLAFEGLRMAVTNMWGHKLRSAMTILGVVIGVGSVIAVTAMGAAFERSITSEFSDIDETSMFVFATSTRNTGEGPPDAGQFGRIFTQDDREALEALPDVEAVIPSGSVRVTNIAVGETVLPFEELTATTSRSEFTNDPDLYISGQAFQDEEPGAVIGFDIARRLGGQAVTPGIMLEVTFADGSSEPIPITGVLAEQQLLFGTANGNVFVPLDIYYNQTGRDPDGGETTLYEGFTVVASDATGVNGVKESVIAYFEGPSDARRLLLEDVRIDVQTADDIVEDIGRAFDQVTIFIVAIAGMSLLVGGIMIGTIMLISVAERTREIGVMKAIGGLDRDILWLFLIEAGLIGLVGSAVGVGAGMAGGYALVEGLFDDIAFVPPYDWIAISVVLGILTGILAGFFPARRATKIQPVEALGYE